MNESFYCVINENYLCPGRDSNSHVLTDTSS